MATSQVLSLLQEAEARFMQAGLTFGHGTDNAWDEAVFLLCEAAGWPVDVSDAVLSETLSEAVCEQFQTWVETRIATKQPAPYLTGQAYFAGMRFAVNESVLVPRSPIAELILNQFEPWVHPQKVHRALDMATGSGCIGLAMAQYLPHADVTLSDISEAALTMARHNAETLGFSERVHLVQSDLFKNIEGTYDLIVSNPPYVDGDAMAQLAEEYQHEPRLGLAAGVDGLDLVKIMLREAGRFLTNEGVLIVEVGDSAAALEACFPEVPFLWLSFERGGDGVFLLTAETVRAHQASWEAAC